MKIMQKLWNSGLWAPLAAAALFMVGVLTKVEGIVAVGYLCMAWAVMYMGWFAPDVMRAKELQARAERQDQ